MEGMDIAAYTGVITDMVTALGTAVPSILSDAAVVALGLYAFRLGWKVIRGTAK